MKTQVSLSIPTDAVESPRPSLFWPLVLLGSLILTAAVVYMNVSSPVRSLLVFWFLLVCPGLAYIRLLKIQDWLVELALSIGLSLALDSIVALVMLYTQAWIPTLALGVLLAITLVGTVFQFLRILRTWH